MMKSANSNSRIAFARGASPILRTGALLLMICWFSGCSGGGGGNSASSIGPGIISSTTGPTLNSPVSPTTTTSTTISGTALRDGSTIRVEGGVSPAQMMASADRSFALTVALRSNQINRLFITELFASGAESPVIVLDVVQDQSPPIVTIDFPPNGARLTSGTTDVAGRVSDLLSGMEAVTVNVNGISAVVNTGHGTHGSFFVPSVPLSVGGLTLLQVNATDSVGNSSSRAVTVEVPMLAPEESFIATNGGNNQVGPVQSMLADPISVRLVRSDGMPFVGKVVTFAVERSSGLLSSGGVGGSREVQILTDASGVASAFWTLGVDAGPANNRVRAFSRGVVGDVYFCADALPGAVLQLAVGAGDRQVVSAGGPLGEKLRAWVHDGSNGVANVPVTFEVSRGDGRVDGALAKTVLSGSSGHAEVSMITGDLPDVNLVTASIPGLAESVTFVSEALIRMPSSPTSFSGVVLDPASHPIEGVLCSLSVGGLSVGTSMTDAGGQFLFPDTGGSGIAQLTVDGSVATMVEGVPIAIGSFPTRSYDFYLIAETANRFAERISLPILNPLNERIYDGTAAVQLTVAGTEDFEITVAAGSVTFADGSSPSVLQPLTLSLNQVQADDLPATLPDGGVPNFAWVLGPEGVQFDPPAQILSPNLAGLPPGAIAQFFGFNSRLNRFDAFGTGQISLDGSVIEPDAGVGIRQSGIGVSLPPYPAIVDCKNCNVRVTGPLSAAVEESVTYIATAAGAGTVTWNVLFGVVTDVKEESLGPDENGIERFSFSFVPRQAASPGSPTQVGFTVEATLTCPGGLVDSHSMGVTVTP